MSEPTHIADLVLEHCQRTREDITSRPFTAHLSQWLEAIDALEADVRDAIKQRDASHA